MSDCFDHMCDAYERMLNGHDDYNCDSFSRKPDKLYFYGEPNLHYNKVKFDKIEKETDKAILIRIKDSTAWVPKMCIRELTRNSVKIIKSFTLELKYENIFSKQNNFNYASKTSDLRETKILL